jgi:hypothetical protein
MKKSRRAVLGEPKMNRSLLYSALTLALVSTAPAAHAALLIYQGTLSGLNEVPPNNSPGTGLATVSYDTVAHTLKVDVTFSGLTGTTTASHIHVAPALNQNGPVATQLPTFVGFPLGVTAGSYSQQFDLTQASSWNPAFIASNNNSISGAEEALALALRRGLAYVNVHSTPFPGGEVRANLTLVPEPGSWMMMIAGFGLTGMMLRRRKTVRVAFA